MWTRRSSVIWTAPDGRGWSTSGGKADTDRRARARAVVRMCPETAATVARGDAPKGDVLGTARIAGIQAAKRTDELIPLAHPLPLSFVDVEAEIDLRRRHHHPRRPRPARPPAPASRWRRSPPARSPP